MRKAYLLAQKSAADDTKRIEQAFPDSWVATTAPLALGLLTDIASELVMNRHQEGQGILWPLIAEQYRRWMVGRIYPIDHDDDNMASNCEPSWFPCEALVRIAANELLRLPQRILSASTFLHFEKDEQKAWVSLLLNLYSNLLMENNQIEKMTQQNLIVLRRELQLDSTNDDESVDTPFGSGRVMSVRNDLYTDTVSQLTKVIPITIIELDFGAILFQPVSGPPTQSYAENVAKDIPTEVNSKFANSLPFLRPLYGPANFVCLRFSSGSLLGKCCSNIKNTMYIRLLSATITIFVTRCNDPVGVTGRCRSSFCCVKRFTTVCRQCSY